MLSREYRGVGFAVVLFVLVQLGAVALVPEFLASGYEPVEDPQNPANSVAYIAAVLGATALMLAAFRFDLDRAVRLVIVGVSGLLAWYVFGALLTPTLGVVPAAAVSLALLFYPEWYVIDAAGVVMGAGAAGLFGISFGPLPALVLLSALAVYDAISVYGTEHMLSLAEGVMDLQMPVVLVIPLSASYSLFDDDFSGAADVHESDGDGDATADGNSDGDGAVVDADGAVVDGDGDADVDADDTGEAANDEPGDREAFFIGLGDAVIPAVLAASAVEFSPAPTYDLPLAVNAPAVFAMVGTVAGLLVLMRWVMRGRAHAGLPLLNGGAIAGYLVGSLVAGVSLLEAVGLAGVV